MRRYLLLIMVAVGLVSGCENRSEPPVGPDEGKAVLSFKPSFDIARYNAVKSAIRLTKAERYAIATKASSSSAFVDGDRVGIYLTKKGQPLKATFNALDNKLFEYSLSGDLLSGVPQTVFYPDITTPVTTYAYYPYSNTVTSSFGVGFQVSENTKTSDVCYAKLPEAAPTTDAKAIQFSHSLSKLVIQVDVSRNDKVEKLIEATMIDVLDSCYLNLTDGSVRTSTTHSSTMTQSADSYFILPAQALHSGRLIRLTCKMKDGSVEQFNYEPASSPLTLEQGKRHTITLFVNDNNSVAMADNQSILPWVENSDQGVVQAPADNDFTIHWELPNARFAQVASATLNIKDYRNNNITPYTVTAITHSPDNNTLLATYGFNLSGYDDLHYPYTIETIVFKDASGGIVQECKKGIAAVVYRGGSVSVGLKPDFTFDVTQATIDAWGNGTVSGDVIYEGPVTSNPFSYIYCSGAATATTSCMTVNKMVLTINGTKVAGGSDATFATYTMTGDQFAATSNEIDITSAAGTKPANYPYFVTKIVLWRGAAVAKTIDLSGDIGSMVEVTRSGDVVIQVME